MKLKKLKIARAISFATGFIFHLWMAGAAVAYIYVAGGSLPLGILLAFGSFFMMMVVYLNILKKDTNTNSHPVLKMIPRLAIPMIFLSGASHAVGMYSSILMLAGKLPFSMNPMIPLVFAIIMAVIVALHALTFGGVNTYELWKKTKTPLKEKDISLKPESFQYDPKQRLSRVRSNSLPASMPEELFYDDRKPFEKLQITDTPQASSLQSAPH